LIVWNVFIGKGIP